MSIIFNNEHNFERDFEEKKSGTASSICMLLLLVQSIMASFRHIAIIVSIRLGKAKIDCLLTIRIAYKLRAFFASH